MDRSTQSTPSPTFPPQLPLNVTTDCNCGKCDRVVKMDSDAGAAKSSGPDDVKMTGNDLLSMLSAQQKTGQDAEEKDTDIDMPDAPPIEEATKVMALSMPAQGEIEAQILEIIKKGKVKSITKEGDRLEVRFSIA